MIRMDRSGCYTGCYTICPGASWDVSGRLEGGKKFADVSPGIDSTCLGLSQSGVENEKSQRPDWEAGILPLNYTRKSLLCLGLCHFPRPPHDTEQRHTMEYTPMTRKRKGSLPQYCHHKTSGQAYVRLKRPDGTRHVVYLGPFGSDESKTRYANVVNGLPPDAPSRLAPEQLPEVRPVLPSGGGTYTTSSPALTLRAVWERFAAWSPLYYRKADGTVSREVENYRDAGRELLPMFGTLPAKDFDRTSLRAVRDAMVLGRVAPAGFPAGAPPDPDKEISTIRLHRGHVSRSLIPRSAP
jgi:hypothetical protein